MSDTSNYGGEREWCGICQRHYPPHLFFSHKCETRREPTSEERIASLTAERDALKAELLGQVMGPTDGELDIIAQLEKERDSLKEALTRENDQCVKWADACGVAEARAESAEQALRALRELTKELLSQHRMAYELSCADDRGFAEDDDGYTPGLFERLEKALAEREEKA